jgi:hypothetical protein
VRRQRRTLWSFTRRPFNTSRALLSMISSSPLTLVDRASPPSSLVLYSIMPMRWCATFIWCASDTLKTTKKLSRETVWLGASFDRKEETSQKFWALSNKQSKATTLLLLEMLMKALVPIVAPWDLQVLAQSDCLSLESIKSAKWVTMSLKASLCLFSFLANGAWELTRLQFW